jgi:hypothetical protein
MRETGNHMTPERLAEIQARIKAQSPKVTTVGHMQTDEQRVYSAQQSELAKRRNTGLKRSHKRAVDELPEAAVLRDCSRVLEQHPRVSRWWRVNTGAMKMDNGRYVKFSFVGASDLMFILHGSGRFGACECKATGKKPTEEQQAFLDNVTAAGGFAICVDHPADLLNALNAL